MSFTRAHTLCTSSEVTSLRSLLLHLPATSKSLLSFLATSCTLFKSADHTIQSLFACSRNRTDLVAPCCCGPGGDDRPIEKSARHPMCHLLYVATWFGIRGSWMRIPLSGNDTKNSIQVGSNFWTCIPAVEGDESAPAEHPPRRQPYTYRAHIFILFVDTSIRTADPSHSFPPYARA